MRRSFTVLMTCGWLACAPVTAPAAPATEPTAPPATAPPPVAAAEPTTLPTSCARPDAPVCVPDRAFVKRLCNGSFPDVALALMAKSTPFTRMYMKGDVDGWNADGGASARARLRLDEEMLLLERRAPSSSGVVVGSGGAGYLVMRWDGNCYTLDDAEVTAKKPASPRHAPLPWRFYAERTKSALLGSEKILAAYQRRGRECKGAMSGEVSKACEQADAALSSAVVSEVREGMAVPAPERLP
ncbi:MAG: hypothetical protein KF819_12100 [Labilithrix sp.]|nr:hypothetical protein [Labilithrix sp.]